MWKDSKFELSHNNFLYGCVFFVCSVHLYLQSVCTYFFLLVFTLQCSPFSCLYSWLCFILPSPWSLESADFGSGDSYRGPQIDSRGTRDPDLGPCIIKFGSLYTKSKKGCKVTLLCTIVWNIQNERLWRETKNALWTW